jgi:hypothetical protein
MASTYSNLKIQLMATGENSGTWGNVTNDNLGVALEEAIVGSADVTFASGTVTLTLTNTNASQTARNLRLNLLGTSGGAQNLIVPAIEKIYIINNTCADAITVKNNSGTGIAVPAGKTMWVYNNGTNVVDAVTHLTSLTLATALPVASGGTGSNTATFSGANITSLNASSISSGTIDNARTTATNANGASTIVARDASGNFVAHDIQFDSFGVGTAASGVSGEIRATNNVTAFYTSDRKFKTNIQSIPHALVKVAAIGGKTFEWTEDYLNDHGGEDGYFIQKNDFGVIAQDVQSVFPIAVRAKPDGTLAVDYEKLCALAFAAIIELKAEVDALKGA